MKKFFKWSLLLIAVIVVALALLLLNPSLLKKPLEGFLAKTTGYSIFLDGDIDLDLGETTALAVTDIRVLSPSGTGQAEIASLGELNVTVLLPTLFTDTLRIPSIRLNRLKLTLETDAEGNGNWETSRPEKPQTKEKSEAARLIIRDVELSGADVRYKNGKTQVEHTLVITSYIHKQQDDGFIQSKITGELNKRPVEYSGLAGPFDNLLTGENIRFESSGHFGDLAINGKGLIDNIFKPERPVFNINLDGPDIDEITSMLGIEDLGGGVFSLRAMGVDTDQLYESSINGSIGDVSLAVTIKADSISTLSEMDLDASINGPRLGAVMRSLGIEHWPDKPFSFKAKANKKGKTLDVPEMILNIGGTQLKLDALLTQFPDLDSSKVKLNIAGDDITQFHELLGFTGLATGPFNITGRLDSTPDGLELVNVDIQTSLGEITVSGNLGDAPAYLGSKLRLHVRGDNAQALLTPFDINVLPEQPFNLNGNVEVIDKGAQLNKLVLVTADEQRLEASGLLTFEPGIANSELDVLISGPDFSRVLTRLGEVEGIPAQPFEVTGSVRVLTQQIEVSNAHLVFAGLDLKTGGIIQLNEKLNGSSLDFEFNMENISDLQAFELVGDSLGMLKTNQALSSQGILIFRPEDWQISQVNGQLGNTTFKLDGILSQQSQLAGSELSFSFNGPDLQELFSDEASIMLAQGAFNVNGKVQLNEDTLVVDSLAFDTPVDRGKIDIKLAWPVTDLINVDFNIDIQGDDFSQWLGELSFIELEKLGFKLRADGSIKDNDIELRGFESELGNLTMGVSGKADSTDDYTKMSFHILANSEDLSALGRIGGTGLPQVPLDLSADLSGDARNFLIRNLDVSLGDSQLAGEMDILLEADRPSLRLNLLSSLIDISRYKELIQSKDKEPPADKSPDRLIPAIPVPIDSLASMDIDIDVSVNELKYTEGSLRNVALNLELFDGQLQLHDFSFDAPRGNLRSSLTLTSMDQGIADINVDLFASDIFINFSGLPKDRLDEAPVFDLELHATGSGKDLQQIAGSANGGLSLKSTGGMLEGVDLSLLDTFILDQVFNLLMPKSKTQIGTRMTCSATILDIKNGLVTTKPALTFSTDKIAIETHGTIDLNSEKMNLNFNAVPTNALKISAGELIHPFILISGTLANPQVGLDQRKAILHGGAAMGTAGISILAKGVLNRLGNVSPLCEELLDTPLQP